MSVSRGKLGACVPSIVLSALLASCTAVTGIEVAIDSDLDVDAFHVRVEGTAGALATDLTIPLAGQERPVRLILRPASDPHGPLTVDVRATRSGVELAHQRVRTRFVADRVVALPIRVGSCACSPPCLDPLVCDDDQRLCVDAVTVAPESLGTSTVVPRPAATCESRDAQAPDASVDASSSTRVPCSSDGECAPGVCIGDVSFGSMRVCRSTCAHDADCTAVDADSHCIEWRPSSGTQVYACSLPCDPVHDVGCPGGESCALLHRITIDGDYAELVECQAIGATAAGGSCQTGVDPAPGACGASLACAYDRDGDGGLGWVCEPFCDRSAPTCATGCCGAFSPTLTLDGRELGHCGPC
jgi:hypothetical protein